MRRIPVLIAVFIGMLCLVSQASAAPTLTGVTSTASDQLTVTGTAMTTADYVTFQINGPSTLRFYRPDGPYGSRNPAGGSVNWNDNTIVISSQPTLVGHYVLSASLYIPRVGAVTYKPAKPLYLGPTIRTVTSTGPGRIRIAGSGLKALPYLWVHTTDGVWHVFLSPTQAGTNKKTYTAVAWDDDAIEFSDTTLAGLTIDQVVGSTSATDHSEALGDSGAISVPVQAAAGSATHLFSITRLGEDQIMLTGEGFDHIDNMYLGNSSYYKPTSLYTFSSGATVSWTDTQIIIRDSALTGITIFGVDAYDADGNVLLTSTDTSGDLANLFMPFYANTPTVTGVTATGPQQVTVTGTNLLNADRLHLVFKQGSEITIIGPHSASFDSNNADNQVGSWTNTTVVLNLINNGLTHLVRVDAQTGGNLTLNTLANVNVLIPNKTLPASTIGFTKLGDDQFKITSIPSFNNVEEVFLVLADQGSYESLQGSGIMYINPAYPSSVSINPPGAVTTWSNGTVAVTDPAQLAGQVVEAIIVRYTNGQQTFTDVTNADMGPVPTVVPTITGVTSTGAGGDVQIQGTHLDQLLEMQMQTTNGDVVISNNELLSGRGGGDCQRSLGTWTATQITLHECVPGQHITKIYALAAAQFFTTPWTGDVAVLSDYTNDGRIASPAPGTLRITTSDLASVPNHVVFFSNYGNGGDYYNPNGPNASQNPVSAQIINWDATSITIKDQQFMDGTVFFGYGVFDQNEDTLAQNLQRYSAPYATPVVDAVGALSNGVTISGTNLLSLHDVRLATNMGDVQYYNPLSSDGVANNDATAGQGYVVAWSNTSITIRDIQHLDKVFVAKIFGDGPNTSTYVHRDPIVFDNSDFVIGQ